MPFCCSASERSNPKHRESEGLSTLTLPDPLLKRVFSECILQLFPRGPSTLHFDCRTACTSIGLKRQGWEVTFIDISGTGIEQARQHAGPLASHIYL
jgi:hypothetical protein